MTKTKNPWKTLTSKPLYDNKWIEVVENQVINPGGGRGIYGKVHFKNQAIGIIPVDNDFNTWLVGQYRYTLDEYSWEIPEGGAPCGETPLEGAKRELKEETGLLAKDWQYVMRFHTSNSVTDEVGHIFLARNLDQGPTEFEESEADLVAKKIPLSDAIAMVMDQKITDSMSVAGLLKVARILNL
ncbi:MAG: NUDIX hydrolase [Bacteroidota bacterium]